MSMEYVYGRLRGRRARLLKPEIYETLIREDLSSYENVLKDTRYGRYLTDLKTTKSGLELYISAVNRAFADEVRKVESFLEEGKDKESLDAYLSRWDLYNFITVIRGKFYNVEPHVVERSIFPAGVLDEVRLRELLQEEDAVSAAERAKIAFKGLPFTITREAILSLRNGDLAKFEYHIYSSFYSNVLGRDIHDIVKEFYNYTIDSKNISMAYISLSGGERPSYWLDGGFISPKIKRQVLAMEDVEELEELVRRYVPIEGAFSLEKIDSAFERKFYEDVKRGFSVEPVSFFAVMEYLWRVEMEAINLRTLIYAKSFGIGPERIKEVIHV
ncbi:MAG: hypothetical protein GXO29_06900 [Thermotogae bacterium]|nr:hypothetical protein [Thermotogota bacterium]